MDEAGHLSRRRRGQANRRRNRLQALRLPERLITAIIGALLSAAIAVVAYRARALSRSGAIAATLVGITAVSAGWRWGVLLVAFFLSSTALSMIGARRKARLVDAILVKTGPRDAWQVLANGGIFGAAAAASIVSTSPSWSALGIGALAASTADTWATEVGTLLGGEPRSIVSGERVPPGTSGGISVAGSAASLAGAAFIAVLAPLTAWDAPFHAIAAGGVAGALVDSLLGATVQERYRCDACGAPTEQPVHRCGERARHAGGIRGLDNDGVNVLCSLVGALVALVMS
ncbi:MAG TPA: DUF92 domain-containing protein [Gemmatimonadaceae bacterium]|nr:DUF92 domain-containing protein [Gemmatimonadaceae bacterium]